MKKRIAIILAILLIFSILPIEQFFAFATSFSPDLTLEYDAFVNERHKDYATAQNKLEEAKNVLDTIGTETINERFQNLNYIVYAMYGVEVYGSRHGDIKRVADYDELKRDEFRYLGYDYIGDDVTNTYFPDDETSTNQDLLSKDWQTQPDNHDSWDKAQGKDKLIEKILTMDGLTYKGEAINYTLSEIIGKTNIETLKHYIKLQTLPKFLVDGSVRAFSKGGDGIVRYRTFILPHFAGDKTLEASITTEDENYTIENHEDYVDIPVTVSGEINTTDSFLESYIAEKWVEFDGIQAKGESHTFIYRVDKDDLTEGENKRTLTGNAGIKSSFKGDSPVTDSASTEVTIIVKGEEDKLIAMLDLPKSAGINEAYTVNDVSYIPDGKTILSSMLTKKMGSSEEKTVDGWTNSTKSIVESSPVKTTITYTLTIMLNDGQVDTASKSIEIIDARNVDAEADLELDAYTYEGHPAYARDVSIFDVDGETYNASKAYEENLASNDFDVVNSTPHTINRLSDTKAKIVFEKAGWYNVKLQVRTKDGKKLNDTESIEVRKTPYANVIVGGTQKQNRKQILNISVAKSHPITNFWVEIKDTSTGEKVHLTSAKVNSTNIKTRNIETNSTEFFQNYTLEFLTKNNTEKVYQYTVYVKDAKGDMDTVSDYFTVIRDEAPQAVINLPEIFYRDEKTNVAKIIAEDKTISSDGDQVERHWSFANTEEDYKGLDELYYSWEFKQGSGLQGFYNMRNTNLSITSSGFLNKCTGSDPHVAVKKALNTSDVAYAKIYYSNNSFCTGMAFFWGRSWIPGYPYSGQKVSTASIEPYSSNKVTTVQLEGVKNWEGTIDLLRWDFMNSPNPTSGEFTVHKIELYKSSTKNKKLVGLFDFENGLINRASGKEYALPSGFTIENTNRFNSGKSLSAKGVRWAIPLADLGITYNANTKVFIEADIEIPYPVGPRMIFSFYGYDLYLPSDLVTWNTGRGWERRLNVPIVNKKIRLGAEFDFSNADNNKLYIDGIEQLDYTRINTSNAVTSWRVGNYLNIGSWGAGNNYPANFYLDNLKIYKKGINFTEYNDLSFGTKQKIEFDKVGVGNAAVKLEVREVWTEPTLDEYVSDNDRLTGSTTAVTEVKNIAPLVSLEPVDSFKEDVFVLTTENKVAAVESSKNTFDGYLKSNVMDSKFAVSAFDKEDTSEARHLWNKQMDTPNKYEGRDFGLVYQMDDNNFYRVKSTLTDKDGDGKLEESVPFTIEAFDNSTGNLNWSYTLSNEYEQSSFRLKNDDSNKYLYVVPIGGRYSPEKILIIDKKTGAFVASPQFDYKYLYSHKSNYKNIDDQFYIKDDNLYILNRYGINVFNILSGTTKKIADYEIYKSCRVKGKVHFGFHEKRVNYRGVLDLNTGSIEKQFLTSYGIDQGYTPYDTVGIDVYGNIVLYKGEKFFVYNIDNICIKIIESSLSSFDQLGVVTDTASKITHVYTFNERRTSKDDLDQNLFVAEIYGNRSNKYHYRDTSAWTYSGMMFAKSIGDRIYFLKAGERGEDTCSSTPYEIDLNSTNRIIDRVGTDGNAGEYSIQTDNYVAYVQVNERENRQSYQRIYMNKMPSTLEGNINRALNKNVNFENSDFQKNIVIIDNEHSSNTSYMSKVIESINKIGAKFTSIGSTSSSNYLVKIKNAVNGNAIPYNTYSMNNNMYNLANVLDVNKQNLKNPVINFAGSGNSNGQIYKKIELEPGAEYCYEYDIQYTNKGSMTHADIFDINHSLSNTGYAGTNHVAVGTGNIEFENFDNDDRMNPFFSYNGDWTNYNFKSDVLMYSTSSNRERTGTQEIAFTTDTSAILSFDYGYMSDIRYRKSTLYRTKFEIYINGVKQNVAELSAEKDKEHKFKFYKEIPAGSHVLKLVYKQYVRYRYQYAWIDNLKVASIIKKTNGSYDNGALSKDTQIITENEWQNVSGTYRAPYDVTQYAKISNKSKIIFEDFSDSNLKFNMSMEGHHVSGNTFRPIHNRGNNFGNLEYDDDGDLVHRKTHVTFSVPAGHIGYFGVWANGWQRDCGDDYGIIDGDGISRVRIDSLDYRRQVNPLELYANKYNPGTYRVNFTSKSYYSKKKKKWDDGYLSLDSMFLKLQPIGYDSNTQIIDDTGNVYAESKYYNEESTIRLKYSSTKDSQFLIKNFKLYKIQDGEKILQHEFDTLSQDQLNSLFDVSKYNAQINVIDELVNEDKETPIIPIYSKGELIAYNIYYSDFEYDPSKKQYWQYSHTPFNDGLHPDRGKILNAPIERFWVDGKYTVTHWQEDSTGITSYDKESNKEKITFYVMGESTAVPEVTYIKTLPTAVKEGQTYRIQIGVDDEDLDDLDTTIELYLHNQLIYTYTKNNVSAVSGIYPPITSGTAPAAVPGKYTIVATAKDDTGVGLKSYEFTVVSEGKVEGEVHHTEQWNKNRKKYNLSKTGDEERPRGYNVFWSGEKFVLEAKTEGKPHTVHVEILNEGYSTTLNSADNVNWSGELWDKSMVEENNYVIIKWGRYKPETLTFRFTAYYDSGITRTHNTQIIVDHQHPYWQLRRAW